MTISVGSVLTSGGDRYHILKLIKEGGFGKAFLAVRSSVGSSETTQLVVKIPADHVLANPIWSRRFTREARILANINHVNVVKIIAFWRTIGGTNTQALVQELVSGAEELDAYAKKNPSTVPSLLLQALYGLRAFHGGDAVPAVHRDLTPRNILVSDSMVVKIIDFGLAKEDPRTTEILTVAGEKAGTPGCMAPEQIDQLASVDHRADLYALGRSFAAAIQMRHPQVTQPERLTEPWKAICLKLTEYEPGDRPASADAAIELVMESFAAHDMPIDRFDLHVAEMRGRPVTPAWQQLCQQHFCRRSSYGQEEIRQLSSLGSALFGSPFDAGGLFERLEVSPAMTAFADSEAAFEDADPLGALYARIYPHIDAPRRQRCFRRLCEVAVSYYRFAVMSNVRDVYASETDLNVRRQLSAILDREDPQRIIQGRGIIPGRLP